MLLSLIALCLAAVAKAGPYCFEFSSSCKTCAAQPGCGWCGFSGGNLYSGTCVEATDLYCPGHLYYPYMDASQCKAQATHTSPTSNGSSGTGDLGFDSTCSLNTSCEECTKAQCDWCSGSDMCVQWASSCPFDDSVILSESSCPYSTGTIVAIAVGAAVALLVSAVVVGGCIVHHRRKRRSMLIARFKDNEMQQQIVEVHPAMPTIVPQPQQQSSAMPPTQTFMPRETNDPSAFAPLPLTPLFAHQMFQATLQHSDVNVEQQFWTATPDGLLSCTAPSAQACEVFRFVPVAVPVEGEIDEDQSLKYHVQTAHGQYLGVLSDGSIGCAPSTLGLCVFEVEPSSDGSPRVILYACGDHGHGSQALGLDSMYRVVLATGASNPPPLFWLNIVASGDSSC
ncbi:MAG: hypothetical protein MHM6MM_004398 [Cercozoa sp. M6MM]